MEGLSTRTAQEVLDDHLKLDEHFGAEKDWRRIVEEDIRRNVSEDVVVLINRGTFRGHDGVRDLASMLGEELPEHCAFEYTYRAVEGWLSWSGPTRTDPARLRPKLRGLRLFPPQPIQGGLEAGRTRVDRQQTPSAHDALHLSRSRFR